MTKKHFIAIANIIKCELEKWQAESLHAHYNASMAEKIADYFETVNPLFDRERFMNACNPD